MRCVSLFDIFCSWQRSACSYLIFFALGRARRVAGSPATLIFYVRRRYLATSVTIAEMVLGPLIARVSEEKFWNFCEERGWFSFFWGKGDIR